MVTKIESPLENGPSEKYVPTPREAEAIDALQAMRANGLPSPGIKIERTVRNTLELKADHPDEGIAHALIMRAVGTADYEFYDAFLGQLVNAGTGGKTPGVKGVNFMLSVVKGIAPRDQIEAMLAAQMAAVHMASMTFARRLTHVENIQQQDSAERAFNKLTRTFASQMETLKRYRSTGEQRMTVEHQHVTVNEGGQAIVGNVTSPPGGGNPKKPEEQPHAKQLTHAPGTTLPRKIKEVRQSLPLACR